jgi:F-box/WD-40 domain protein MET30
MTGSWDRTIRIWNLDKLECIQTLTGHTRGIKCLQFDTNKLISGGMDHCLKLWNWRTGECIRTIQGHQAPVSCLNFDNEVLASGSADSTIRIWNFNTGAGYVLRGHQEWVNTVALDTKPYPSHSSRTLKLLYSGSDDGQIRIWNLGSRETLKILIGHVAQVQSLSLRPSSFLLNDSLISGSLDNCIKLWNIKISFDLPPSSNHPNFGNQLLGNEDKDDDDDDDDDEGDYDDDQVVVSVDGFCERTLFGHIQGVWSIDADKLRIVRSVLPDPLAPSLSLLN